MYYTFNPMTEEQLSTINLLADGIYEFKVLKATRKTSTSGNPMCELQLKVIDQTGASYLIFDYLVFSSANLNIKKVLHFCDAVGLQREYDSGKLPEELTGYCGKVHIIVKKGDEIPHDKLKGKPAGTCYPDKNAVEDYIKSDKEPASMPSLDDIPF